MRTLNSTTVALLAVIASSLAGGCGNVTQPGEPAKEKPQAPQKPIVPKQEPPKTEPRLKITPPPTEETVVPEARVVSDEPAFEQNLEEPQVADPTLGNSTVVEARVVDIEVLRRDVSYMFDSNPTLRDEILAIMAGTHSQERLLAFEQVLTFLTQTCLFDASHEKCQDPVKLFKACLD